MSEQYSNGGENTTSNEKRSGSENHSSPNRRIKPSTLFWSLFIGFALLVAVINIGHYWLEKSLVNATKGERLKPVVRSSERLKEEVLHFLEENNRRALRAAWEKSLPQVEELKKKNLAEVKEYIDRKLRWYFKTRIVDAGNVDRFLDWYYSLTTDYQLLYLKGKDLLSAAEVYLFCFGSDLSLEQLKRCKSELQKHTSAVAEYIGQRFREMVLKPKDLELYIDSEILPYMDEKFQEFQKGVLKIVTKHYGEELKKLTFERFGKSPEIDRLVDSFIKGQSADLSTRIEVDLPKISLQTASSVAVGAFVYKALKPVAKKIATKVITKVAAKMAAKGGSKLASALAGFEGGALLCSWAGPFDLVCAAGGAVVATVATDYLINKVDEKLTRDDMKKLLLEELETVRTSLGLFLYDTYRERVENFEAKLSQQFLKKEPLKGVAE